MTTEELLQWADDIVLARTGKHLDSVQTAILEGAWQGLKYEDIAKNCHRSKSHIKNIASELWQTLSELLGEDINKVNARSILERKAVSNIYNYGKSLEIFSSYINSPINICAENRPTSEDTKERSPSPPTNTRSPIIDLTDAPEPTNFYNRTSELAILEHWILQAHTRLITLYGLSEIGKSAIALKLIEQIQTNFDYIIWRSLSNTPTLSTLQTELKQFFGSSQPTPLSTVIDYFRSYRCLVILDDVQNIFKSNQLAGQYLAGYEDYSKFFKQIATSPHQSCLILLTWEKPRELTTLEGEHRPAQSLHLQGLGEQATEILQQYKLTDEEQWSELIARYQGHPSWLNIIASTICELFDGSVSQFLAEQTDIYLGDIEPLLDSHLKRLSESEKKVNDWLAIQNEAIDISQQPADSELSKSEFWQAIQSLARRGLVEKIQVGGRSLFFLNPVFKTYIQTQSNIR